MFKKFQQIINNYIKEDVTTSSAFGDVSPQYGVGKVTSATEADMSIAGGINPNKKRKSKKKSKIKVNKAVLYTARRPKIPM